MSRPSPATLDLAALRNHLVGKEVSLLDVYGANSLKSVDPPPSSLTGDLIAHVSAVDEGRGLRILLTRHVVSVDLARTGVAIVLPEAERWAASSRTNPPTARLLLADGTGIDFKEPARTKRITFAISRL